MDNLKSIFNGMTARLPISEFKNRLYLFIFYGILIALVFPLLASKIRSIDIWKALYTGRYLWLFSEIPHHSTFTYSPVRDFVARETNTWLGNILLYGLYRGGGYLALQLFRASILLSTVVLIHSLVNFSRRISILCILLFFCYAIDQKLHLRTAIFAIPSLTLFFWLIKQFLEEKQLGSVWAIPPLLVLWSNLHPSYLLGVVFLLLLMVGETVQSFWEQSSAFPRIIYRLLTVFLVSLLSVFLVKPFPDRIFLNQWISFRNAIQKLFDGSRFFADLISLLSGGFIEPGIGISREFIMGQGGYHFVLKSLHLPLVWYSISFGLVGVWVFYLYRDQLRLSYLLIGLAVLPIGLRYTRTVAYLPLTFCPLMLILFGKTKPFKMVNSNNVGSLFGVPGVLLMVFTSVFMYQVMFGHFKYLTGNPRLKIGYGTVNLFSDTVPNYILEHYPNKHFLNPWGEGTYLIWKWWPYKKVYVDSKAVPYKMEFLRHYDSERVIKKVFNYVVLWKYRPMVRYYRKSQEWRFLVEDKAMIAFRKMRS